MHLLEGPDLGHSMIYGCATTATLLSTCLTHNFISKFNGGFSYPLCVINTTLNVQTSLGYCLVRA